MSRFALRTLTTPVSLQASLREDVLEGFRSDPKVLLPKYFYDVLGSGIFEAITELPEYYVTRAETAALVDAAPEIVAAGPWNRLVELGSGSSTKTRTILEEMHRQTGDRVTYEPLDISPSAIEDAGERLVAWQDWLDVDGCVVDFLRPEFAEALAGPDDRLITMLGSTLGNLFDDQREVFLRRVREALGPRDRVLFGIDLIKDPAIIEPAYNDDQGVTEEFNKNVIRVLQRELGLSVGPDDFRHHAPYVEAERRVEMRLHAVRPLDLRFDDPDVPDYSLAEDEYLLTEVSRKFDRESLAAALASEGLRLDGWWTDPQELVALALVAPESA